MNYPIKPLFYKSKPNEFLTRKTEVSRHVISCDEQVSIPALKEGEELYFDFESSDNDVDTHYLVVYRVETIKNPNYAEELDAYNKDKAEYDLMMVKYNAELEKWQQVQKANAEARDRAEYERLKKIFG